MTLLRTRPIAQRVEAPFAAVARRARPERDVRLLGLVHRDGIPDAIFSKACGRVGALAVHGAVAAIWASNVEVDRVAALVHIPFLRAAVGGVCGDLEGRAVGAVLAAGDDVEVEAVAPGGGVGHVDGLDVVHLRQLPPGVAP